jgi:predicted AAA+ superfamily ATPase
MKLPLFSDKIGFKIGAISLYIQLMKRKAQAHLLKWYQTPLRKPLMISGARQVGKTTLVNLFGQENQLDVIRINLEQTPLRSLEADYDVESFLKEVCVISKKSLNAKTLLFLDEIQVSPKCIVMLRYLFEQKPELPVIAAGSLLEFLLNDFPYSIPVGRLEYFHLGPMTFEEFLWAHDEHPLTEQLGKLPILETVFALMEKKYREFLFVGGMPAAVKAYITHKDPESVRQIHRDILTTYKEDINKYAKGAGILKTSKALDRIGGFIGRKFKYSEFLADYPSRDIKRSLELLKLARIIHFCIHTNGTGVPLKYQEDESVFKIYFLDVGLYNSELGTPWDALMYSTSEELINKGVICEQFVAQHLAYLNEGKEAPQLYYWLKDKKADKAEVDFIIAKNSSVLPIEVKSGATGHLKSLSYFMYEKKHQEAFRLDLRYRSTDYITTANVPVIVGGTQQMATFQLNQWPVFFVSKLVGTDIVRPVSD